MLHLKGFYWTNPKGGQYGSTTPIGWRNRAVYPYDTKIESQRASLITFLKDTIPNNNYILFYTVQGYKNSPITNYDANLWANDSIKYGTNIFSILEKEGAKQVRELANSTTGVPYIFIYKKGVSALGELKADSVTDRIRKTVSVNLKGNSGIIETPTIGPSKKWKTFEWDYTLSPNGISDSVSVSVYCNNKTSGLWEEVVPISVDKNIDLSTIDATIYPELKLYFYSVDNKFRTTAQLDYWRVYYDAIPEGALDANTYYTTTSDTAAQGKPYQLGIAYKNISDQPMDSVLVSYNLSKDNVGITNSYKTKPLAPNDTILIKLNIDTKTSNGINKLLIDVNPNNDQIEQYHFNNVLSKNINILKDVRNPFMEVTFDEKKIYDGDVVNPFPKITIHIKDDNKLLLLNEQGLIEFKIYKVNSPSNKVIVPIDSNEVKFFPATSSKNQASLDILHRFLVDGKYQLSVNAKDKTGNKSGDEMYTVNFQIVNKSQISNVFVYPNPFSTSAQFVYTLTGEQTPKDFKIQILTLSGKVVKEITQMDLGPMQIGTQRSEYRWDGTDELGDKLANGVYLYKVIARKSDGTNYENFDTNTDIYFKNGIGKLVIMR
jgi:hypothetical protein